MNIEDQKFATLQKLGTEEIPMPEDHFRRLGIASRPTFFRWERQGLRVLHVGGRRFIYASELRRFLEFKDSQTRDGGEKVSNLGNVEV